MGDTANVAMQVFEIRVESEMVPYLQAAATRAGYLWPDLDISVTDKGFLVRSKDKISGEVKRDLLHTVYREKIWHESADARVCLLKYLFDR